jgi:hypothetical protein
MEANEKCVRSYMPHGIQFLIDREKLTEHTVLIPGGHESKPYALVKEDDLVVLMEDKTFKSAMENNLIKILPAIPVQFQDQADTLVQVRSENGELKSKLGSKDSIIADKDAKIAELLALVEQATGEQSGALTADKLKEMKDRVAALKIAKA